MIIPEGHWEMTRFRASKAQHKGLQQFDHNWEPFAVAQEDAILWVYVRRYVTDEEI